MLAPDAPAIAFSDLSPQQAAGLACVVCRVPYDVPPPIDHVPVGVAAGTAYQVFACEVRCAPLVGYVPPEQLGFGTAPCIG